MISGYDFIISWYFNLTDFYWFLSKDAPKVAVLNDYPVWLVLLWIPLNGFYSSKLLAFLNSEGLNY